MSGPWPALIIVDEAATGCYLPETMYIENIRETLNHPILVQLRRLAALGIAAGPVEWAVVIGCVATVEALDLVSHSTEKIHCVRLGMAIGSVAVLERSNFDLRKQ